MTYDPQDDYDDLYDLNQPSTKPKLEYDPADSVERVVYRGEGSDPLFGLVVAGAVAIGLSPLIGSGNLDLRFTVSWGLLAGFGVLAWLLGSTDRIEQEQPENLAWGVAFGLILGIPILAFGGTTLVEASELIFRDLNTGTALAYLVFVMPLAETLFFRNLLQAGRTFWGTGIITTIWQLVLFFPLVNRQAFPILMGVIFLMSNLMFSYVRERNGLAAAWLCQIVVNIIVLFVPFSGVI